MATDRRRDADWYEQELKRHELAAARRLTAVLPADQSLGQPPRPAQLGEAWRVMDRSLRDLARLRLSLDGEIERLQGRERPGPGPDTADTSNGRRGRPQPAGRRRLHPEVPRYHAARNAIDDVIERWERRRDQLAAASGKRQAPAGKRPPAAGRRQPPASPGHRPARARR